MILIIDNYDSFVYNLYQYIGTMYEDVIVKRNDEITIDEIKVMEPEAIIISPGPGYPKDAGISKQVVKEFAAMTPILGVCLGHQAIGEVFGGQIIHAKVPVHGKKSDIHIDTQSKLFKGLPDTLAVGRYHSLVVNIDNLPECFKVIALSKDEEIMAIEHQEYKVYGLQFHPESILTEHGKRILKNFIKDIVGIQTKEDESEETVAVTERNILKPYIKKVILGEDLLREEAQGAMNCIMSGGATDAQIASLLTALSIKGETVEEITGFAKVMREKSNLVKHIDDVLDIVGTGGDMAATFNISTTSAFVVAGTGVKVAKHGNRSVSSRSGSADVLEKLGVKIDISVEKAEKCLEEIGICFMFAPCFHKSMRYAAAPRREIGVRSVFNILGPLANPAYAEYILLGVYDKNLLEVMAKVLMNLGVKSAVVAHGSDGLDEVTVCGPTLICELNDNKLIKYEIIPEQFSINTAQGEVLVGGNAKENAQITLDILQGKMGPRRDIVLLNSAVALYSARKVKSINEGIELAEKSIDSGAAMQKLNELIKYTNAI